MEYVRRCKRSTGSETHERVHGVFDGRDATLCGKQVNEMWFMMSKSGMDLDAISCPLCRRVLRHRASR
jgi:hypothetical protein